ncbi:EF-hand domain-containing protein [Sphingomonas sp. DC2300-3]|uniref:EF-hand domain-containing protein n=1 Tax=unclassified Sphingomonas TaxID=196159 RepID=UPI003CF6D176
MLLTLLLQAATPVAAPAQPPATLVVEPVAMAIAAFDSDGDGRTTRAELAAGVARSFAAIDTAHTGSLGYIDFADWSTRWLGDPNALPSPFEVDSDGDNRITLAELQAAMARVFARLDVDRDGVVTRKECLTIRSMATRAPDPRGDKRKR